MELKPIETVYRGYRFRSRLEARWAVFLETCGLQFDYEPEGYDLDGLWYLPDFWIHPQMGMFRDEPYEVIGGYWLEVKGQEIKEGDESWRKAQALADASGVSVVVFCGQIKPGQDGLRFRPRWSDDEKPDAPERVEWIECPWCHRVSSEQSLDQMTCLCSYFASTRGLTQEAAHRAMQARFEHRRRDGR